MPVAQCRAKRACTQLAAAPALARRGSLASPLLHIPTRPTPVHLSHTRALLPASVQEFAKIAAHLPGRTVQEVVALYYAIQHTDDFAHTRRKYLLRKRREQVGGRARVRAGRWGGWAGCSGGGWVLF